MDFQNLSLQLRFSLSRSYWLRSQATNLETQNQKKMDRNPLITNHRPWPCLNKIRFPKRTAVDWSTSAQNANVTWLLNFRVPVFLKSAVKESVLFWTRNISETRRKNISCTLKTIQDKSRFAIRYCKRGFRWKNSILWSETGTLSPIMLFITINEIHS